MRVGSHGQHLTRRAGCLLHGQTQADVPSCCWCPDSCTKPRQLSCAQRSPSPLWFQSVCFTWEPGQVSARIAAVVPPGCRVPPVSASGLPVSGDGRNGWRAVCSSPLGPGNGCSFAQQSKEGKVYFNVELSFRCCFAQSSKR